MSSAKYTTATDTIDQWQEDILTGTPPVLYQVGPAGTDVGAMEIGPGIVTLIGGAPGAGKTAFTMQLVTEGLRFNPDLRALVCNIEMSPSVLLDRQLARLAGIDLNVIRHRQLDQEHADRIDLGMSTLSSVADRLAYLSPPYDLDNVGAAADDFGANLLVLDYIQRIAPPRVAGPTGETRSSVNKTMDFLRRFASAGVAVMVVSAVGRSKDSRGRSSYAGEGLNLASFRESSELEFGADDAYILHTIGDQVNGDEVRLNHLKSRHGECRSFTLSFDRRHQRFDSANTIAQTPTVSTSHLTQLWEATPPAEESGGSDE